jgi:hypothetical protein
LKGKALELDFKPTPEDFPGLGVVRAGVGRVRAVRPAHHLLPAACFLGIAFLGSLWQPTPYAKDGLPKALLQVPDLFVQQQASFNGLPLLPPRWHEFLAQNWVWADELWSFVRG